MLKKNYNYIETKLPICDQNTPSTDEFLGYLHAVVKQCPEQSFEACQKPLQASLEKYIRHYDEYLLENQDLMNMIAFFDTYFQSSANQARLFLEQVTK